MDAERRAATYRAGLLFEAGRADAGWRLAEQVRVLLMAASYHTDAEALRGDLGALQAALAAYMTELYQLKAAGGAGRELLTIDTLHAREERPWHRQDLDPQPPTTPRSPTSTEPASS